MMKIQIKNAQRSRLPSIVIRMSLIFLLVFLAHFCFLYYEKWNEIPNQTIKANLSALGYTSIKSYCNFKIQINGGSTNNYREYANSTNKISV